MHSVVAFYAIINSNISIPTTYTVHIVILMLIHGLAHHGKTPPHPSAFDQSKVGLGGASASIHQHIGGRSDTAKWNENDIKVTENQNNIEQLFRNNSPCFPEFVAHKYWQVFTTHRFRSQGPWPDRMNWEDLAFAIADCVNSGVITRPGMFYYEQQKGWDLYQTVQMLRNHN